MSSLGFNATSVGVGYGSSAPTSQAVVLDWMSQNSINALLDIGGTDSFFTAPIKTHISFGQEFFTIPFKDPKYGTVNQTAQDKTADYLLKEMMHVVLPGIIGVQGDATQSQYPYLVSHTQCGEDLYDCVPSQEKSLQDLFYDFAEDAEASVTALRAGFAALTNVTVADWDDATAAGDINTRFAAARTAQTGHALSVTRKQKLVNQPFAHWCYGVGYRLTEYLQLNTGGLPDDLMDYNYLYAWQELSGGAGRREMFQVGCAPTREALIRQSLADQHLYINMPWWFSFETSNSMALVRAQLFKQIYMHSVAQLSKLIVVSDDYTLPEKSMVDPDSDWAIDITETTLTDRISADTDILSTDLIVELVHQVVYLEDSIRAAEMAKANDSTNELNVLAYVNAHAELDHPLNSNKTTWSIPCVGTNPIVEAIIVVSLKANRDANQWFNFSRVGPESGTGSYAVSGSVDGQPEVRLDQAELDPLVSIRVDANKQQRWHTAHASEYRVMAPAYHHSNIPDMTKLAYIYVVPGSLFPEDATGGSGGLNPGRLDDVTYSGTLHPSLANVALTIYVYLRLWTVYTYKVHTLGPRYIHSFDAKM